MEQFQLKNQISKFLKKKELNILNAKNLLRGRSEAGEPTSNYCNKYGWKNGYKLGGIEEDSNYEKNKKIWRQVDYSLLEQKTDQKIILAQGNQKTKSGASKFLSLENEIFGSINLIQFTNFRFRRK